MVVSPLRLLDQDQPPVRDTASAASVVSLIVTDSSLTPMPTLDPAPTTSNPTPFPKTPSRL